MVDSTSGCEQIYMLDAYQGYHQIPLALEDQEKSRRNVEVYVDDILINFTQAVDLIANVEETCRTLWEYGLKMNTLKCLFGARGEFLGYLVTERGIEANLEKMQALQDMQAS
ncbi:uncharacterized protein LOC121978246 [Zingiber officinale]|uniref:uncharacterized protein LOC121978246 n=1 Tax=Zingiber officinale TaxID=94328 RepID=UPI001C4ACB70|nr:uncharacterized protein LOC121978246 [Zingiber officinale]